MKVMYNFPHSPEWCLSWLSIKAPFALSQIVRGPKCREPQVTLLRAESATMQRRLRVNENALLNEIMLTERALRVGFIATGAFIDCFSNESQRHAISFLLK